MIKKTLFFGNPAYLSLKNQQLSIEYPGDSAPVRTIPVEDVGFLVLDHPQITVSHALIAALLKHNAAIVTSDEKHMPTGLLLCLDSHSIQQERFREQLQASEPLKKQLWQQTVKAKIYNQAMVAMSLTLDAAPMFRWADEVKSGDSGNLEAKAAAWYWDKLFEPGFRRHRFGDAPNNMLNYGYAVLRAVIARAITGAGLLPTMGIFHKNRYNSYCLADDIMEPYRPVVDDWVIECLDELESVPEELTPSIKASLLKIPVLDVRIDGQLSPLMLAAQRTAVSLAKCFGGESRKILYPEICRRND